MVSKGLYNSVDNGVSSIDMEELNMNSTVPLIDFIDTWLELFKKSSVKKATYSRLLQSRNTFAKCTLATKSIGEINLFDIQRYVNGLVSKKYSISTIKKQVEIVTAPLKRAAAMKIIPADPTVGIELPNEDILETPSKEIVAYTEHEQKIITKAVDANRDNTGYLAMLFMIETGIRSGELLALKWSDIDISRCRMRIHATITNPSHSSKCAYQDSPKSKASNRTVPLTPKALTVLKVLQLRKTTQWVFEQDGERYTYKKLSYQTKKLCKDNKIPYYGEHAFRHTFATNCYYKGIDVKILSKLMGHSSVQVTYNTYIHLYGDGFDAMYAALCF